MVSIKYFWVVLTLYLAQTSDRMQIHHAKLKKIIGEHITTRTDNIEKLPLTYGKASCLTVPKSMVLPSEIVS